jgi:hypothetical protein
MTAILARVTFSSNVGYLTVTIISAAIINLSAGNSYELK